MAILRQAQFNLMREEAHLVAFERTCKDLLVSGVRTLIALRSSQSEKLNKIYTVCRLLRLRGSP